MKSLKKLIINADDYGSNLTVNQAVEELAIAKLLGGVSVLANGSGWEAAAAFLQSHSNISVGVHLNLVEGRSVATDVPILLGTDGNLLSRGSLLARWLRYPGQVTRAIEREWRAQIERLLAVGLKLDHADSHQHLHAFPAFFRITVRLCAEYNIPALRMPAERNRITQRKLTAVALRGSLAFGKMWASKLPLQHNDHFLGFKRAGGYGITELLSDLPFIQEGITELALHPSTENFNPYPSLCGNDEREAVLSPIFREQLEQWNIELTQWSEI